MQLHRFIIMTVLLVLSLGLSAQVTVAVWPGDADANGTVNNLDFLQLGLAYNYIGPVRQSANVQWNPQMAQPFSTNPNGINSAYADADGNGLVNYLYDAFPIFVHYGLNNGTPNTTVYQQGLQGVDPKIQLDTAATNTFVQGGDAISLPIVLGTAAIPVEDLYGIAFSVHVDSAFINTQQVSFNFNETSWANHDNDRFSAAKAVSSTRIDVAWVRTDHNHRSGYGRIGKFDFIIIDDIVSLQQNMTITIDSIRAIDRFGNEFAMVGDTLALTVMPNAVTNQNAAEKNKTHITIAPNPSAGQIFIESQQKMEAIRVYDGFGRLVHSDRPQNTFRQLYLGHLPKSIYVVEVQTSLGILRRQILLQ